MTFLLGLIVGVAAAAAYQSERLRAELQRWVGRSPDTLRQAATQTVVDAASDSAQRVSEAIDASPLPDAVKKPASDTAFSIWSTAESHRESPDPTDLPDSGSEPTS